MTALVILAAYRSAVSTAGGISALGDDMAIRTGPAFAGREAGSPRADSAAAFLAQGYERLGLRPDAGYASLRWRQYHKAHERVAPPTAPHRYAR